MYKSILTCILIGSVTFISCKHSEEEKKDVPKFSVTSAVMLDTSFEKEYVTEIQSIQNVEIRAKVKGYIETINVDEGQYVREGQLLFTIRPREYEAELQKAKAIAKSAELEMNNIKTLSDKNIVAQSELAIAKAKLDEAKADVALAELYVTYTQIRAPFDGVIDRIPFKIGSLIDEGTLLTSISNNKNVFAYFNVSESEYLDYKSKSGERKNTVTLLMANNQPHKYKGTIETIEGQFDKNTGSIAFRAKFPNPEMILKHGETGKVLFTNQIKNAMIIPQRSTFEIQDKVYVFVVDKNNKLSARNVVVRQRLQNLYIIDSGISLTDKFVLENTQNLNDDDVIIPVQVDPMEAIRTAARPVK